MKDHLIAQLHVSNGILMKFSLAMMSQLGALVSIEDVLLSVEQQEALTLKLLPNTWCTMYSAFVKGQ